MDENRLNSLKKAISLLEWDLQNVTNDAVRKNKQARLAKLQEELRGLSAEQPN
ncbi:hypothetical protein KY363_00965 [Candidatus Woesearchaeota archaeon]|nr:hypothetical protein [Candidatus Woesearchaeota archaeon]